MIGHPLLLLSEMLFQDVIIIYHRRLSFLSVSFTTQDEPYPVSLVG